LAKILKIPKKSGFGDPRTPGATGFYINPSRGLPRDPAGTPEPSGPCPGPPPGDPWGGAWTPVPGSGIRDPSGDPGGSGRPPLGLPTPSREGARGLFYINPSRRGPAVPQGVPPGTG